jgi:flavin reductase (DIM6/NTAB) family NADH-FMN oxidoreductase RutF
VKSPDPNWKYGQGVNGRGATLDKKHVEIDPYAEGRPMTFNYKLLISSIVPRPIWFLSTQSVDGETKNLSPMSYFQVVNHDPPMFIVGFSVRAGRPKETCHDLKETGECVTNVVSENMMPAVNATSLNTPYGVSEWAMYNGEARMGQGVSLLDRREIDGSERVRTPRKARHEFSVACRYRDHKVLG